MIKVKAKIKLYIGGRITPFTNGYSPLFNFIEDMKTSGYIKLININEFYPGDEQEVEIYFMSKKYLGNKFEIGKKFTFGEGKEPLGEGEVIEIHYD